VPILVPDAGPLITLAYADRLDLLQRPGWPVHAVDMRFSTNPCMSKVQFRATVSASG